MARGSFRRVHFPLTGGIGSWKGSLWGELDPEQAFCVFCCCGSHGFRGEAAELRDFFCHERHKARVVAAASEWLRGHVGAVRFDEDALQRDLFRDLDRLACVFKRHDAGKADVPAALDQPKRQLL